MKEGRLVGQQPAPISEAAREDIRNLAVPLYGVDDNAYDRVRDQICGKYGISRYQVGNLTVKMKRKRAE